MEKRIKQYITNFKNEQHNSNMPIPLVRQFAVDNKFQSQYDWNGTLKIYIDVVSLIENYSTNIDKFMKNFDQQDMFIKRVENSRRNLKNIIMYFYINPPSVIRDSPQCAMSSDVANEIVRLILICDDFITLCKNYDYHTITKFTLIKRRLFSSSKCYPSVTALAIISITVMVGIGRYFIM